MFSMQFLLLFLIIALVGFVWYVILLIVMVIIALRPKRMNDARALILLRRLSPSDLDIDFEDIEFHVLDESSGRKIRIAGWWMPNPAGGSECVIILHGYSDAKVGGIAWAPMFRSLGFHILAIDLRAHGESDGVYTTAGFWERHDLNQVIEQIKLRHPSQTVQLVVFGVSLGGAVSAAMAAGRDDLAAIILESPFSDFSSALTYNGVLMGLPGRWFQQPAFWIAEWLAKCDFDEVAPRRTIPMVRCPLMLIQSGDDPHVSPADAEELALAVANRKSAPSPALPRSTRGGGMTEPADEVNADGELRVVWRLPGVFHVMGLAENPGEYEKHIGEFLSGALSKQPASVKK
jgi:alpha-beta hydrolase superfamily lysophospholipase